MGQFSLGLQWSKAIIECYCRATGAAKVLRNRNSDMDFEEKQRNTKNVEATKYIKHKVKTNNRKQHMRKIRRLLKWKILTSPDGKLQKFTIQIGPNATQEDTWNDEPQK